MYCQPKLLILAMLGAVAVLTVKAPEVKAQIVNVSEAANRQVKDGPSVSADLSWERKTGNTDVSIFSGTATGYYKQKDHLLLLLLKREYGEQRGDIFANSAFQHLRYRYAVTTRLDAEAFVQQDRDPFRRLRSRMVYGAGPRYEVFGGEEQALFVGAAPMYEREIYEPTPETTGTTTEEQVRLSVSVAYNYKIDDRLTLQDSALYQPVLKDLDDHRLVNDASLVVALSNHLDFKATATVTHDASPPVGVASTDQVYKNSLVFNF